MANYKTTVNKDGSQQFVRGKNFLDQMETIYGKDGGQSEASLNREMYVSRDRFKEGKAREMMFQAMMDEIDTGGTSGKAVMKGRGGSFKGVK